MTENIYSAPQANDLEKIIKLVEFVGEKRYQANKLEKKLQLQRRQINYYRQAAEVLSLIEQKNFGNYGLTRTGRKFLNSNTHERSKLLIDLIYDIPLYRKIIKKLPYDKFTSIEKISNLISKYAGLSKNTAQRRTTTFLNWAEKAGLIETEDEQFLLKDSKSAVTSQNQLHKQKIWLWSVSPDNWEILSSKHVWASYSKETIRKLVRPGDVVIFYVSKIMQIKGVFEFVDDWYDAKKPLWSDETRNVKYPSQIKIKPIKTGSISIKSLLTKLDLFQNTKSANGKLSREQSLILKPGTQGFPSNNKTPIPHKDYGTILELMNTKNDRFFEKLNKKGLNKTHIQVLEKFHLLRRRIIQDSTEIRGQKGKSAVPADSIVDKPHYLHNLVRGVYKSEGVTYALSIQTNPKSKWGQEISFNANTWAINYDFEDAKKYASDIKALKKCYDEDIPIGVIYKHRKGINEILGLGKITQYKGTLFEIREYNPAESVDFEDKIQKYATKQCEHGDYSSPNLETSAIRRAKQDWFREQLVEIYGGKCAFCGFGITEYLIGSHIFPFSKMQKKEPENSMNPKNGLLLCRQCDFAFEKGHIILNSDFEIEGSEILRKNIENDPSAKSWVSHIKDNLQCIKTDYRPAEKYINWKLKLNES